MESAAQRLQNLIELRDSGLNSTTVDGVTTTFRSQADLERAINRLQRETGKKTRPIARSVFQGHR